MFEIIGFIFIKLFTFLSLGFYVAAFINWGASYMWAFINDSMEVKSLVPLLSLGNEEFTSPGETFFAGFVAVGGIFLITTQFIGFLLGAYGSNNFSEFHISVINVAESLLGGLGIIGVISVGGMLLARKCMRLGKELTSHIKDVNAHKGS